jgi:hypothetical protein
MLPVRSDFIPQPPHYLTSTLSSLWKIHTLIYLHYIHSCCQEVAGAQHGSAPLLVGILIERDGIAPGIRILHRVEVVQTQPEVAQ